MRRFFCVRDAFHIIAWQGWRQLHGYEASIIIGHKKHKKTSCRPVRSVNILVINHKIGLSQRGRPITDRIGHQLSPVTITYQAQYLKIAWACKLRKRACRQNKLQLHFTCTNRTTCSVCICLIHTRKDWTGSDGAGDKTILYHKKHQNKLLFYKHICATKGCLE